MGVHGRAVPPLRLGRICWAYGVGGVSVGVGCLLRLIRGGGVGDVALGMGDEEVNGTCLI